MNLVNQLASGTKAIAGRMAPLLSSKNEFLWTVDHDQAVLKSKKCSSGAGILQHHKAHTPMHRCK